jgi:soluble lytic murein transglycosylase
VLTASQRVGLPPALLWSLMRRESFYDAEVVSLAGAHGLLQLLPTTAAKMASAVGDSTPLPRDLHQPRVNLRYGSVYLAQLLQESDGDVYQALSSYNAGEGNGRRWAARRDPSAPPQETILWISYSETRAYVYHVLRSWQLYQLAYDALACADGSASR